MIENFLVILAKTYSKGADSMASSFESMLFGGTVIAITLVILIVLLLLALVALLIAIICGNCELLRKAKEPKCWKALIPVYGTYVLWKLVWDIKFFWIWLGIVIGALICSILSFLFEPMYYLYYLFVVLRIADLVFVIISLYRICKAFGHGGGWTCGLVFLYPIFLLMLAFGKSEYQGNVYQKSLKK